MYTSARARTVGVLALGAHALDELKEGRLLPRLALHTRARMRTRRMRARAASLRAASHASFYLSKGNGAHRSLQHARVRCVCVCACVRVCVCMRVLCALSSVGTPTGRRTAAHRGAREYPAAAVFRRWVGGARARLQDVAREDLVEDILALDVDEDLVLQWAATPKRSACTSGAHSRTHVRAHVSAHVSAHAPARFASRSARTGGRAAACTDSSTCPVGHAAL
jgi:hypothetical protein